MTRREYLERRVERRQEWASKAAARSGQAFERVHKIADNIPLGQPILVGHHSEKHARADAARIDNGMRKGCEEHALVEHHESKADGLARQLDHSIFSDDEDAIEALEARIAEREAKANHYAEINKAWRKAKGDVAALVASGLLSETLAKTISEIMRQCPWLKNPMDTTNLRALIRADRERIVTIKARATRSAKANAAGGILIEGDEYVRVTFAEKPERSTIDALKDAGFSWSGGSWIGKRENLPAEAMRC